MSESESVPVPEAETPTTPLPSPPPTSADAGGGAEPVPLRGYKVCNEDRSRKYGVAANSLEMLRRKAAVKLEIPDGCVFLAYDGTAVTDEAFFEKFAPQTLFIIARPGAMVSTDLDILYAYMRENVTIKVGSLIENFINENRERFVKVLRPTDEATADASAGAAAEQHLRSSSREEHEEWFKGQPATLDTKEKVMRRRAQDRIRGYYYKTKDEILASELYRHNAAARQLLQRTLDVFAHLLQRYDYMGQLFQRDHANRHPFVLQALAKETEAAAAAAAATAAAAADDDSDHDDTDARRAPPETPKKRRRVAVEGVCANNEPVLDSERLLVSLCDELGRFRCQGVWNRDECAYSEGHVINPYASRENAVLFQVWNLDHGVEMTRTIVPDLLRAVQSICGGGGGSGANDDDVVDAEAGASAGSALRCREHGRIGTEVAMVRYFREVFTVANLSLVHIVCHDKTVHGGMASAGGVLCDQCAEFAVVRELCAAVETE